MSPSPRVSFTKAQLAEGIGAELFSLCQSITADGLLAKDEIVELRAWLQANRDAPLPGIAFLTSTMERVVADGRVTRNEQRELLEAIEKVLPPDARRDAKSARKAVEAKRKAAEKALREEQRQKEREEREKRWPENDFDFMVAGVHFDGRHQIISRNLRVGDRVRLVPEPDNPKDDCAVAITLMDGRKIGYVPRTDSEDVTGCIEDGGYYFAEVKTILTGGRCPIPVIVLAFYRLDQLNYIQDLRPEPCPGAIAAIPVSIPVPPSPPTEHVRPWWRFW